MKLGRRLAWLGLACLGSLSLACGSVQSGGQPATSDASVKDGQGFNDGPPGPDGLSADSMGPALMDSTVSSDVASDVSPSDAVSDALVGDGGPCLTNAMCGGGMTCCISGACVDTMTDPNNCGSCGYPCAELAPNSTCQQGVCAVSTCSGPGGMVANELAETCVISPGVFGACCGGACRPIDTASDPANCGGCGLACPVGASCHGACEWPDGGMASCLQPVQPPGQACPPGDVCSPSGACVQQSCASVDAGSGDAGGGGERTGDLCVLPAGGAEGACCGTSCIDTMTDDGNCGFCGNVCQAGSFCSQGACTADPSCSSAPPNTPCPVAPGVVGNCCVGACVDFTRDALNCGMCGAICPNGGSTCAAGLCTGFGCFEYISGTLQVTKPGACPAGDLCSFPLGAACAPTTCGPSDDGKACAFGDGVPLQQPRYLLPGSVHGYLAGPGQLRRLRGRVPFGALRRRIRGDDGGLLRAGGRGRRHGVHVLRLHPRRSQQLRRMRICLPVRPDLLGGRLLGRQGSLRRRKNRRVLRSRRRHVARLLPWRGLHRLTLGPDQLRRLWHRVPGAARLRQRGVPVIALAATAAG